MIKITDQEGKEVLFTVSDTDTEPKPIVKISDKELTEEEKT